MNNKIIAEFDTEYSLTKDYLLKPFTQIADFNDLELNSMLLEIESEHVRIVNQSRRRNENLQRLGSSHLINTNEEVLLKDVFYERLKNFLNMHRSIIEDPNSIYLKILFSLVKEEIKHYNNPCNILDSLERVYFKYIPNEKIVLDFLAEYIDLYKEDDLGLSHLIENLVDSFITPNPKNVIEYPEIFYTNYVNKLFKEINRSTLYERTQTQFNKEFDKNIYPFLEDNMQLFVSYGYKPQLKLELMRAIYNKRIEENEKDGDFKLYKAFADYIIGNK